ncbi:MAG: hypothetical protein LBD32_00470, partial [Cytophagales bacterium]|nr:hypothetical protein [Cytophagales bacterium]
GKSTFLQHLTGLKDAEIPTGGKGDCTGVAAIIKNESVSNAYADIEFYSQEEFLNQVIAPFYDAMDLPRPLSLEEFAKPLPDTNPQEFYDEKKMIKLLQQGLPHYQRYLGEKKKRIEKDEIRNYTAKSDQDGQPLVTWASVKSAEVHCKFQSLENEKISVGDTPGLGDRNVLDAEKKLMEDFGKNIDAIIMLRKVKERGIRKEDINLFYLIKDAIPELEPGAWSYFMVNVFSSDKSNTTTKEALEFLPKDFRDSSLRGMRSYIEVDCSNEKAVLNEFDKILTDISNNQNSLDEMLYNKRLKNLQTLIENIYGFIEEAKKALKEVGKDNLPLLAYQSLFDTCWQKISNGLENEIKQKYRLKRDEPDPEIENKIDLIKEESTKLILEKLNNITPEQYAGSGLGIFSFDVQHDLRIELANAFDALDNNLEAEFIELRKSIVDLLRNKEKGKLDEILGEKFQNCSPEEWLKELANCFQEIPNSDKIVSSIRSLINSTFTFRGYLLPQIRDKLDVLDSDSNAAGIYSYEAGDTWEGKGGIRHKFEIAWKEAMKSCTEALKGMTVNKNRALFATIDQFCDGILRSGGGNAKKRWLEFYDLYKESIWDIFKKNGDYRKLRSDYNLCITKIENSIANF